VKPSQELTASIEQQQYDGDGKLEIFKNIVTSLYMNASTYQGPKFQSSS
jgi:hypothetical protein